MGFEDTGAQYLALSVAVIMDLKECAHSCSLAVFMSVTSSDLLILGHKWTKQGHIQLYNRFSTADSRNEFKESTGM